VTGSAAGLIRFWDGKTGKAIAALMPSRGGVWTATAADGRFDTDEFELTEALQWVLQDDPLTPQSVQVFARDYYTPGLLARLLAHENLPPVRPLTALNRTQPAVKILGVDREPGSPSTVSVRVQVVSRKPSRTPEGSGAAVESGVYDLRLFRDGQLVARWPRQSSVRRSASEPGDIEEWRNQSRILGQGETVVTIPHVRLPARDGEVSFSGYAFNSDRVRSELNVYKYRPELAPRRATRRAYVVAIGVNANQSGWDLSFAVPSAADAAELWKAKLESDLDDAGVIRRRGATRMQIEAVLQILAGRAVPDAVRQEVDPGHRLKTATPDDAVILYIASHGYANANGQFYVVPFDTGLRRGISEQSLMHCGRERAGDCLAAAEFLDRSVSSDDFAVWWENVDAGEMVMVLDTCYSGAVSGPDFRPGPLGDTGFGQLAYDKGMLILAATQRDRPALSTRLGGLRHTLLVEALSITADENRNRPVRDWLRSAEGKLPGRVAELYGSVARGEAQMPELMDFMAARMARVGR
jgi:hypothetical protein